MCRTSARAKEIIRTTALLELKIVEAGPAPTREALLQSYNGQVPPDMDVVTGAAGSRRCADLVLSGAQGRGRDRPRPPEREAVARREQPAGGELLADASDGSRKFGKVTGENIGRSLAIILDNRVRSAPRIDGRITDEGKIYGSFTNEEVADLSLTLRSGALPASLTYLEERVIGPSLGADSIRAGVMSSLVGLLA